MGGTAVGGPLAGAGFAGLPMLKEIRSNGPSFDRGFKRFA